MSPILGVLGAWTLAVVAVACAVGFAIEHLEYLSMPLMPFALLFSVIFVGLPLGFGLLVVQRPAFDHSLQRSGSLSRAWLISIAANAIYAVALTIPLLMLSWFLGNEFSLGIWFRFIAVLTGCSLVTSLIWLSCNHILLGYNNV